MAQPLTVTYRNAEFQVADQPDAPTYFVFGVRKSGSSVLNSIVNRLAELNGRPFVDVPGVLFKLGARVVDWQNDPNLADVIRPGNVYGGFRNYPLGIDGLPLLAQAKKILMVRDPRDAIVSEYFSNAYSHSLPEAGEGRDIMLEFRTQALQNSIEKYVRERAPDLKRTLRQYAPLARHPNVWTVRYEDKILNKRAFIGEICEFFGWSVSEQELQWILGWADVVPDAERPTEFVRKVTPGDHREKLPPAVIAHLDRLFADEMQRYGYS